MGRGLLTSRGVFCQRLVTIYVAVTSNSRIKPEGNRGAPPVCQRVSSVLLGSVRAGATLFGFGEKLVSGLTVFVCHVCYSVSVCYCFGACTGEWLF
jgi:hypothetical protein